MQMFTNIIFGLSILIGLAAAAEYTPKHTAIIARRDVMLFTRQATCPSDRPNVCDGIYCSQVCCGDGDGTFCYFGEVCYPGGCCPKGERCTGDDYDIQEYDGSNTNTSGDDDDTPSSGSELGSTRPDPNSAVENGIAAGAALFAGALGVFAVL